MEIDTILTIIVIAFIVIFFVSLFIWYVCKNKKIAEFFRKISDWIAEILVNS